MLHLIILKMFGLLDLFKGMFGLMRLVLEQVPFAFDKDAKLYKSRDMEQVIMVRAMSCHIETSEVEIDET